MGRSKPRPYSDRKAGSAFPPELEETLRPLLGDELDHLKAALQEPSPISIRIDPSKGFDPGGEQVPWCSTGRYLQERPSFTFDPLLHAGAYYVQEASSMFLEQAFEASGFGGKDILALDLAAAPGGKCTHLRSLMTSSSLLVANEIDRQRVQALQENLWKWGRPNVAITNSDPKDLEGLPVFFDLIVLDAPCSGEGMFRKDPFALQQWSPRLVDRCARTQNAILPFAWDALVPGGVLIYATCTFEPKENELQLRSLIEAGAVSIEIPLQAGWNVERSQIDGVIGHRSYPHRLKGEGFFLAALRKPGEWTPRSSTPTSPIRTLDLPFVKPGDWHQVEQNGVQHLVEERWRSATERIQRSLRTLAPGIPAAEMKGKDLLPHPALALSTALNVDAVQKVELDLPQTIQYLQGLSITSAGARGHAIATFKGRPLGWLKGTGDRWNNRWPANWRIRSHGPALKPVPWQQAP